MRIPVLGRILIEGCLGGTRKKGRGRKDLSLCHSGKKRNMNRRSGLAARLIVAFSEHVNQEAYAYQICEKNKKDTDRAC